MLILNHNRKNNWNLPSPNKAMPSFKFLISIKPKIKKFIQNKTASGRTKLLNNQIRSYINDITDYGKMVRKGDFFNRFFKNMFYSFEKLCIILGLNRIPLFDPESKLKIMINTIIVTYNCFYIFLISIVLIFDCHLGHHEHTFTYIAMASWITEMIVEMNTACYHDNHFITDRKVIIQIYAKEYFFFEILPLLFEGRTSENTLYNILLHLPLLLKLKGMTIILQKLEFYILQILEKHYIFQLFKLIMQMLLYGHVVACCWNLIVKVESNIIHSVTWFDGSSIESDEWWKRYLIAQYWSFSVMMNVTTKPTTPLELAFTSFVMLLSCIAFGYLLSTVAGIIADLNKQQEEYKKDLNILNSYMKRKKVDLGVKRRVNINLKTYYQQKSKDNLQVETQALGKISNEMLHELNFQANSRIIKQFPFFAKLFSDQSLTKVYSIMEEEVFAPQQIVFTKNSNNSSQNYLYLILKGEEHFIAPNEFDETENPSQNEEVDSEEMDDDMEFKEKKIEPSIVRQINLFDKQKNNYYNNSINESQFMLRELQSLFFIDKNINSIFFKIKKQNKINHDYLHPFFKEKSLSIRRLNQSLIIIKKITNRKQKKSDDKNGVKKKMVQLKAGQIFGSYSFFTGKDMLIDVQCKEFTTLIKINRQKFLDIVKDNKKDYERFCEIKDKIIFNRSVDEIPDQDCWICNSKDHLFEKCHFGHFDKNNILLFFKFNQNVSQERQKQARKYAYKKTNTLFILKVINKAIPDLIMKYGLDQYQSGDEQDDERMSNSGQSENTNSICTEENAKFKKQPKIVSKQLIEEEQKLHYNQIHQLSPTQIKNHSDIEIIKAQYDEEVNSKLKNTLTHKYTLGDLEDLSLIQEENTTFQKSSQGRKQSVSQQPKPRRSLLKFDQANNNAQNNGGVSSGNVTLYNTGSINTIRGGEQSMRRKQSNLNVTSPKMSGDHEHMNQQDVIPKKRNYHKQGSNNTYQTHGTNYSAGTNQSPQVNSHHKLNNEQINLYSQNHHLSTFYQNKQARANEYFEKELTVDFGAQSQYTRLSNQKSGLSQNMNKNQLNYRKTTTTLPQHIQDESLFIQGFDKMKDFQFYFPYFNSQNIIKRANTYLLKIQKKKKIRTGKKGESGTLRKKKQQSTNNLNNTKFSSIQRLNTIRNSKLQSKSINEFSLNIVSADFGKGNYQTPNFTVKSDKTLQEDA